jgi:hypothetical protein
MNREFIKDVAKSIKNTNLNQELAPGSGRRYEPEEGVGKLNRRIHRESAYADSHKNLPFTFRKPPKNKGRSNYVSCDNCGYIFSGTTATVGIICSNCNTFSSVSEVTIDR